MLTELGRKDKSAEMRLDGAHGFTGSQGLCFCVSCLRKLFICSDLACFTVSQPEKGAPIISPFSLSNQLVFICLLFAEPMKPNLGRFGNLQNWTLESSES
jgi:hypothetical protein